MKNFTYEDLDRWPELHTFRSAPPPADDDSLYAWIHALHVAGPHEAAISSGVQRVMRHHTGNNECWLGISGPSHLGKTQATTGVLLGLAMAEPERWRTRTKNGGLHTPYLYIEAGSNQEARGLLASIARACALPDDGSEKDLHRMLSSMLPELGVRLVVVDDAQMFRRRSDKASRVTDGLRVVLHLPVPFVFVGVDLHASALLYRSTRNNDTALQLERRHLPLPLHPLRQNEPKTAVRLIGQYKARISRIPDLDLGNGLSDPTVLSFAVAACEGRPGSLLSALKRATVEAIATNDGRLTADLVAHEVDLERRLSRAPGD